VPFTHYLREASSKPGPANDTVDLLRLLPPVERQASRAFPHAEAGVEAFQPDLNAFRAYVPDLFNGLGKAGQIAGYYDGNGHYVRSAFAAQNLFTYNGGSLEPITKAQQNEFFGSSPPVHRRCPGGATQSAPDGSNPFVGDGGVDPSTCNPGDAPPGP
jgi:hypothetical protein